MADLGVYDRVRAASYVTRRCGLCSAGVGIPCALTDCLWKKPTYVDDDTRPHELTTCRKPKTITWTVSVRTKWARDESGQLYYNTIGAWHPAQEGL